MGCVNPPNQSKETWLRDNGQEVHSLTWPPPDGTLPVCLVYNPQFAAAGIAYDQREFNVFTAPDPRFKRWYLVPIDKLLQVSDLAFWRS